MLTKRLIHPSREDAVRLTRGEKISMMWLYHAATVLENAKAELEKRLGMVENGTDRMGKLADETTELITELRVTIPEEQRMNLQRMAEDSEMRLTPKAMPSKADVLIGKEEFKTLVDFARVKCMDCTKDGKESEQCPLFRFLTVINPLDDYNGYFLCPYYLGEWKS